jgi:hypothetical protein
MAVLDYDKLSSLNVGGAELLLDQETAACEARLSVAFVALSRRHLDQANALFDEAMLALPELAPTHPIWTRVTAFAALPTLKSDLAFKKMLQRRGMLDPAALAALPLPARTNFLTYCIRRDNFALALDLVAYADANTVPLGTNLEAWAFRIGVLRLLEKAGHQNRLAGRCRNYASLVETSDMEPADKALIELEIMLIWQDRTLGGAHSSIAADREERALRAIEAAGASHVAAGVLTRLLTQLALRHLANRNELRLHACYKRLLGTQLVPGRRHQLVKALSALATALVKADRFPEAVALDRRAIELVDQDGKLPKTLAIPTRIRLGKALNHLGQTSEAAPILATALLESQAAVEAADRETERLPQQFSKWMIEAQLELTPPKEIVPAVRKLAQIKGFFFSADALLGLVTTAANERAQKRGHAAPETRDAYVAVASMLRSATAHSGQAVRWRALMSLFTHWVSTKNLAEGLNALDTVLAFPWTEIDEARRRRLAERVSRLFNLDFSALSRLDLPRAVRIAIAVPGHIGYCSGKLSTAVTHFLLRMVGPLAKGPPLDQARGGEASAMVALSQAVVGKRFSDAMTIAARFMQELPWGGPDAEFGRGLGVCLGLLARLPAGEIACHPQARPLARLLEKAFVTLNAQARLELSELIATTRTRFEPVWAGVPSANG